MLSAKNVEIKSFISHSIIIFDCVSGNVGFYLRVVQIDLSFTICIKIRPVGGGGRRPQMTSVFARFSNLTSPERPPFS